MNALPAERTVFVNARIISGLAEPEYPGSLVVSHGRIQSVHRALEEPLPQPGEERIDCAGLVLCPGFIDMHAHSDLRYLSHPAHEAKLTQGITLEVLGQDGLSYAPVNDSTLLTLRERIRGWNGDPAGFAWSWRSVAEYLSRLDQGIASNAAYLVPHGNLRLLVIGDDPREATPSEVAAMAELLRTGLSEGAIGLSAGLTYVPGMYAGTAELVALCRVVAEFGGIFAPHHRNYGTQAIAGYAECFTIARESGVRLHLAHAHLSFPTNEGKLPELLELFADAENDGIDFSFDSYPYLAGMTTLMSQLPGWAQIGSPEEQLARLRTPESRARICHALDVTGSDGHQGLVVDWDTVHLSGIPGTQEYDWAVGISLERAAAARGLTPSELCLDVLIASNLGASCVLFMGIEAHVRALIQHPAHTVGSDGILEGDRPHPRSWGTFPRLLEVYVREEGVLDLAECIRHMTSSPAERLGILDRGRISAGFHADLVVFDPQRISSPATYDEPVQAAVGVKHVLVNGVFALRDGVVTGAVAGRAVRS